MGKLSRIAAAASLVFALSSGIVSAQDITNTGPGSTNSTSTTTNNTSNVVCISNVVISNTNSQTSTSGSATTGGNTSGGSSSSGNASNSNNVTVTVNGACPAGTTAAPADSPAARAAAAGQTNLRFNSKGQLLLPETGTNSTVKAAVIAAAGIAGVAAVSQVGFGAYRRVSNR